MRDELYVNPLDIPPALTPRPLRCERKAQAMRGAELSAKTGVGRAWAGSLARYWEREGRRG